MPPGRLSRQDPRYNTDAFYRTKARFLARWLQPRLDGRPVWVWGAGRATRKRAKHLADEGVRLARFIDIDPQKIGQIIDAAPVADPRELPPPGDVFVIPYVGARGAREQITRWLEARGHQIGRDYIPAA